MANRRILAIVTALVMLGSSASSQQAATIDELRYIERLVASQRWVELYNLIVQNPRLAQGQDALSLELRNFLRQVSLGRVAELAPVARNRVEIPQSNVDGPNAPIIVKSLAASAAPPSIY